MITLDGKNIIISSLATDIDQAGLGTVSATNPNESDTGLNSNTNLGTPAATIKAVSNDTSDKQIAFSYTLLSTEGTATTYKEFGLSSTGTDKLFNRQVFYDLYHGDTDEIDITQVISIR